MRLQEELRKIARTVESEDISLYEALSIEYYVFENLERIFTKIA